MHMQCIFVFFSNLNRPIHKAVNRFTVLLNPSRVALCNAASLLVSLFDLLQRSTAQTIIVVSMSLANTVGDWLVVAANFSVLTNPTCFAKLLLACQTCGKCLC